MFEQTTTVPAQRRWPGCSASGGGPALPAPRAPGWAFGNPWGAAERVREDQDQLRDNGFDKLAIEVEKPEQEIARIRQALAAVATLAAPA